MDSTGALLTKSPPTEIAHGTQWCLLILICSHSGEGGLWFQNNGPIPKDQNQICFAILYNNIYQKHCLWQRETLPQCKAALLIDLSSVQAMTSAWIPCPKNDILCFPQGQLPYFYFLFKPPHPKQNALFPKTALPLLLLLLVTPLCSPAHGHMAAYLRMSGFYPQPAWWHHPIVPWHQLHTCCRRHWLISSMKTETIFDTTHQRPLQGLAHSSLKKHL